MVSLIYVIFVCAVFFAGCAVFLIRFLKEMGVPVPGNRVVSFLTADKSFKPAGETVARREYIGIFVIALLFRITVYLAAWITIGIWSEGNAISFSDFLGKWNLWDAEHYINIAKEWYSTLSAEGEHLTLVFFPLYPALMKAMQLIVRDYIAAGLIVSTLCCSGGCVLMYKLVAEDYSKSVAGAAVALMSVSPFAFFMGGVMTESTFFLITMAVFLAIRKHKWLLAGILGIFAAMTRSIGVFLVFPAAVEWLYSERNNIKLREWKTIGKDFLRFLPVALMAIGTLIYLYINYKVEGNPLIFIDYQRDKWNMTMQFFAKPLRMQFNRGFNPDERWMFRVTMFLPGLFSVTFAAIAILLSARRLRPMDVTFMIIYFLFNASAAWPLSESRYMACMFPAYWLIASLTDKHKNLQMFICAASAVFFGIFFTGYLAGRNIM